jgi:serine/threonine protein kinase
MGSHDDNGQASRGSQSNPAAGSRGGGVSVDPGGSSASDNNVSADTAGLAGDSAGGGSGPVGGGTRAVPAPRWLGKRVGRFRLLALLGQGAMGRVFRAEDTLMGRHVALKLLPRTLGKKAAGGSAAVTGPEALIREARAAAAIEHPNAVSVYEVNQAGDVCYVAMELLEGGSLRDLVRAAGPMDLTRACLLCAEAAEALSAAHAAGVVHRDVKPANLMLSRQGRCKVVDFGLARLDESGKGGEWAAGSTAAESVGTPQFIAPEILSGTPASAASDVYSLGGTLFYLLTGRPPYEAKTARELLKMHVSAPVPDLRAFRPDASRGLADALAKALAKRPAERWASMEQFARVLRVHAIPIAAGAMEGAALEPGDAIAAEYAPPPTPGYLPQGPITGPPPGASGRWTRPSIPLQEAEAAPTEPEPQPESEAAYEPEIAAPSPPEAIAPVPHHALPAWPLLAGGGVLIAAVVAVLCIVFLKGPSADVAVSPASGTAIPKTPAAAPSPAAEPASPPMTLTPVPAPEVFPPSLVARWVADNYEAGSNWADEVHQLIATPRNAPEVVANAFNGHAGVKLNGTNQYFTLGEAEYPLSGGRTMTVIAVFKPDSNEKKGTRFWEGGGLVGADLKDTTGDWGMGWGGKTGMQVVIGAGNFPPHTDGGIASPDLELNRTHVAAMTWAYSGDNKKGTATLTLYVDGVQISEKKAKTEPRLPHIPLALGAADATGKMPFSGLLAEIRLYNDTADVDVPAISESLLKRYVNANDRRSANPFDPNNLLGG